MYKKEDLIKVFEFISAEMSENRDYLIELDQQNGDGDLGITMSNGFEAAVKELKSFDNEDIGMSLFKSAMSFNEKAPSSLGTIISFGLMAIGKKYKGKTEFSKKDIIRFFEIFNEEIMNKGGAKLGEKTVIDTLVPTTEYLKENFEKYELLELFEKSTEIAKQSSEKTKEMKSVHGRAAYYGDASIGILDGGSFVGYLIFRGISNSLKN
ncbi:MAG: dihydroxyacetone kinase subunit L [Tissierellia bacterium]|nr:dihydroxyacetone kinase subunit L [Tissierellia bacterium]